MQSISYELLVDLAEGRMSPHAAAELRTRIATDAAAQHELAAIEELIGLMRNDDSLDAPEHVIGRAVRLMRQPAASPAPGLLQRLVATLRNDTWQTPTLASGLRSIQAWPRALLLSAGDRDLDLQIGPHGEQWQLRGQVLGPELPGAVVLNSADEHITVRLDELGEFVLPPVPAGRYTLTVTHGDIEIVVPELELGPLASQS